MSITLKSLEKSAKELLLQCLALPIERWATDLYVEKRFRCMTYFCSTISVGPFLSLEFFWTALFGDFLLDPLIWFRFEKDTIFGEYREGDPEIDQALKQFVAQVAASEVLAKRFESQARKEAGKVDGEEPEDEAPPLGGMKFSWMEPMYLASGELYHREDVPLDSKHSHLKERIGTVLRDGLERLR